MKMKIKKRSISAIFAVILMLSMLIGIMPTTVFAEEECVHTNTIYTAPVGEPSCFEPAMGGYWFCEDCNQYLDENKQNVYWEPLPAAKNPPPIFPAPEADLWSSCRNRQMPSALCRHCRLRSIFAGSICSSACRLRRG